jgi:acyl-[acyl-carrier-protein]-phospholipid O-acyltransferase/long-chain-fatty-acid--[acyl-carrier-protein] ligase
MNAKTEKLNRSFLYLNATQFLGALNDNVFKLLIIFYLLSPNMFGEDKATFVNAVAGVVFVVPFLLFTPYAGKLADRFSKRNIVVSAKIAEAVVMLLGCIAFMFTSSLALYAILFLMCTQSAFFGPSKYGIVPELVKTEQLSKANSFLEALTYLAIVIGTALAPFLAQITGDRYTLCGLVCLTIATFGFIVSFNIEITPALGSKKKASVLFVRDVWRTLRSIRSDKHLIMAVYASAYFMLLGAFMQMNLIPYGIQQLEFTRINSGYLFVIVAVGIGIGSFIAGKLSGRNVEFGIVPLGALAMAFSSISIALITPSLYAVGVFIFIMGIGAGLFIVPIHAFIQLRSPEETRGQVLAASGFIGWVGVAFAAVLLLFFGRIFSVSTAPVMGFLILGMLTLILAVVAVIILPDFLVRLIVVLLTRLIYRIKIYGQENIPTKGGILLISNHVTWVDSLLLSATQQRRIRFIIERQYYDSKWINWICRLMKAIPISASDPPKKIIHSIRQARQAMEEGAIVCIFAEGALTRTGMLLEFKAGFERITKGTDYSIIPAYLGGAWGSVFSHFYGRLLSTLPKKVPYPISVHFGKPMPTGSSSQQIRLAVTELSCDYFNSLKPSRVSLGRHFVKSARKNWRKRCIADTTGKKLNYGQSLVSAVALAEQIKKLTSDQNNVGILLPPSVAGALTNLAVTILAKVPVNLNYTASTEAMNIAISQADIKCIISSRKFIQKVGLDESLPLVFIEDIAERITTQQKIRAFFKACLLPGRILTNAKSFNADDVATIIFSSGSTGTPKGVMLSHHNIISNIEAARMVFKIYPTDNLAGILPFFHSFGLTLSLWLPIISGVSAAYVPNPLDTKTVGKMVRRNNSTILFATPTFLTKYLRRTEPADFASLREVIVGAEKLKTKLAESFEQTFRVKPREGYGTTELSPLVSVNLRDVEIPETGQKQIGTKPGTIGQPIPGIAVKIVDPQDGNILSFDQSGLLLIKGPNVMLGYLNMPDKTAEAIQNGWYNTKDIASMDEDGFLTITDRLARFSKIAGEMVPHLAIEEACLKALDAHEQIVAVTAVPDAKKGEQLVVLYDAEVSSAEKLHEIISQSDLPNIYKPRKDNFIPVESIPVLGSGKLDIMKVKQIALSAKTESNVNKLL